METDNVASEPAASPTALPRARSLTDFVDLDMLQALQDGFASLTGISTSIRDAEGNPITRPAQRSRFCDLVGSTPSGHQACRQSHAHAAALVRQIDRPCRDECHAGLSQFVAPIIVQGHHLGTILVGDRPATPLDAEWLSSLAKKHKLPLKELKPAAAALAPWSEKTMSAASQFVQQLAGTIAQLCYNAYQLQQRVDELAAVYDIASMLAGKNALQEILDTATRHLVETMGVKASSLRLLDEESGELRLASVANLSKKYLAKGPVRLADSAIDQAALRGETQYIEDSRTDPRILYKRMAREEGLVSALNAGVRFHGKPLGVLRVYMGHKHRFSPFEVSLLEAIASQLAAAIVNAQLRAEAVEAARLERQVRQAVEVQRRMIPSKPPQSPHYEFGCVYQPSSELGGDFYDFIQFDNGDIGVVIADVVGKGIPASLMMASVRSALRSNARRVTDLGEIIRSVNRRLYHDTLPSEFATSFYMELAQDGSKAVYCNAGHEPLLLLRNGQLRALDVGGMALGIDWDETYQCAEIALQRDDVMLLVTDGVTEARDYHDKAFGRERLHDSLRLHGAMPPDIPVELVAKQVLWDVRRFTGLAPQGDDITIVAIRVK